MKKVYSDPSLKYSQSSRFTFPANVNLCEKEYYGDFIDEPDIDNDAEETSLEGVFE